MNSLRKVELQKTCRNGYSHIFPVLRNYNSGTVHCRASQQTSTVNGTATSASAYPVPLQASAPDVQKANLNACVEFLKEELPRIFETGEVQSDRYDPSIKFKDPISNFNDLTGYRVNVRFLATAFDVDFKLLDIGVVSPETIVARWTMEAKTRLPPLLPWKPTAVFTGTSEYKVNPDSGLITEHIDKWDSVEDNEFLSLEAIQYILTSFSQAYTTPELETPDYSILYKAAQYEVRSYQPYLVSETSQPSGAGPASGSGFQELAGYLFGGNEASESMAMTTPVFTKPAIGMGAPDSAKMQFVMERRYSQDSVPAPKAGAKIVTRTEEGGIKAVATFAGFPLDFEVVSAERELRSALLRDGLQPKAGYVLARYNEPTAPPFLRRNEVLIDLEGFQLPPLQ